MALLVENATVITMDAQRRIFDPGYVLIEDRHISAVGAGTYGENRSDIKRLDAETSVVIPGLINAHSHSYGNLIKGVVENLPLEIWMMYIVAAQRAMEPQDVVTNVSLGCIEMLRGGVTCCLDHLAEDRETLISAAQEYQRIGFRVILVPMVSDVPISHTLSEQVTLHGGEQPHLGRATAGTVQGIVNMMGDVAAVCHHPENGIIIGVGPSGPQRCTDELLLALMDLGDQLDLPVHTHLLETQNQEMTAERLYGKSMVRHLHSLGLLSPRLSMAHGVWLTPEDMKLIAISGASVILNPVSNLMIGSGMPPLISLIEAGVTLGLGTDGAASTGCQSMFEVMKLAALIGKVQEWDFSRWPTAWQVLEMATIGNARALGIDHQVGSIESGKEADLVFLGRGSVALTPLNDVIWQLVYGRPETAVERVIVGGRILVEHGQLLTINEKQVLATAVENGERLLARCQAEFQLLDAERAEIEKVLQRSYARPSKALATRWHG